MVVCTPHMKVCQWSQCARKTILRVCTNNTSFGRSCLSYHLPKMPWAHLSSLSICIPRVFPCPWSSGRASTGLTYATCMSMDSLLRTRLPDVRPSHPPFPLCCWTTSKIVFGKSNLLWWNSNLQWFNVLMFRQRPSCQNAIDWLPVRNGVFQITFPLEVGVWVPTIPLLW